MQNNRDKWQQRYPQQPTADAEPQAAEVLSKNVHLLPAQGSALDLACGLGGNALLLAKCGLQVTAWDLAENAIKHLQMASKQAGLQDRLWAEQRDVLMAPPATATFDVIVVSHFLERSLLARLKRALKPGGLLFYQTFCRDKPEHIGPKNPEYLLAENELLSAFSGLIIRVYREEGQIGRLHDGWRYRAMLIAQQPLRPEK